MKSTDKRPQHHLFAMVLLLLLLAAHFVPQPAVADDTEEVYSQRFLAEGRYAIVAGGVGLLQSPSGDIVLDVPGQGIKVAYLYWSGFGNEGGGDDNLTLTRDGGSPTSVTADRAYGPTFWWDDYYYFAYVADVTPLVESGAHTYTISDFGGMVRRDGAGLMVVHEDPELDYSRVLIIDGLDRFYRGWGSGPRAESAVNCFTFGGEDAERQLSLVTFVGEIYRGGAPRPNALWYSTGAAGDPMPVDMVNAPTNGPVTGDLVQGTPNSPFMSRDDPQWDTYATALTIPAARAWACLQVESARYGDYDPASGVWLASGFVIPVTEPPTPTPTFTPTPTPTATHTPSPTPSMTPTPTVTPQPPGPIPPRFCPTWLLVVLLCLIIFFILLIAWLLRRRHRPQPE